MSPVNNQKRHRGESGQVIIIIAFAAIALFAMVGLAIDAGRLYITKAQLSRAMDAAALSGILEFNGLQAGVVRAQQACEAYLALNEPDLQNVSCTAIYDESGNLKNELRVSADKSVNLLFMPVISGRDSATVSAQARAGFGTQYLDVVMVLDATPSMDGPALSNAKLAAIAFKDILLGDSPEGNVLVGMTPFRGCFNAPRNFGDCIRDDTQVAGLTYTHATLDSRINAITTGAGGDASSATNVCTGLAKGWDIMSGRFSGLPNHDNDELYPDNKQYLVLLSDGDNAYWGVNTYQNDGVDLTGALAPFSPTGTQVGNTLYPCMPHDSCAFPWTGSSPCRPGLFGQAIASDDFNTNTTFSQGSGWTSDWTLSGISATQTVVSDNFDQNTNWNQGTGWTAPNSSWDRSGGTAAPALSTSDSPNSGTRHLYLRGSGSTYVMRTFSLAGVDNPVLRYSAKRGSSFAATDRVEVQVSLDGSTWTTLRTHVGSSYTGPTLPLTWAHSNTNYGTHDLTLPSGYANAATVYLRYRGTMDNTSDRFWIDTIQVNGGVSSPNAEVNASNSPQGARHMELRGTGSVTRTFSLSTHSGATISYAAKRDSSNFASNANHRVRVQVSVDGSNWTTLRTHSNGTGTGLTNTGSSYATYTVELPESFANASVVYLRFDTTMTNTSARFYVDTVTITSGGGADCYNRAGTAAGHLNCVDGSDPSKCSNEGDRPRERQLDVLSLELARAIKAQGVEIFVVAFAGGANAPQGCNLDSKQVFDADNPSHCNTVLESPAGPIGSASQESIANHRLLKCMSSNTPGSLDHYFYASSHAELQTIFTQIANQISLRLIE